MRTAPHTEARADRAEEYRSAHPVGAARPAGTGTTPDVAHDRTRGGAEAGPPAAWEL